MVGPLELDRGGAARLCPRHVRPRGREGVGGGVGRTTTGTMKTTKKSSRTRTPRKKSGTTTTMTSAMDDLRGPGKCETGP